MTRMAREEVRGATVETATPLGAEDWERRASRGISGLRRP